MTELHADPAYQRYLQPWPADWFTSRQAINPYEHTYVNIRLEATVATNDIPGDIVDCGVYKGDSIPAVALLLEAMRSTKKIWACDSFGGFPGANEADKIDGVLPRKAEADYFADTSETMVRERIRNLQLDQRVNIVPGFYEDTLPKLPVEQISLVILDCDLYDSYHTCLKYLYPKISPGGIIIFDEYFSPKYPGARKAVDEFFADKPEKPQMAAEYLNYHHYERWYLVKAA